MTRHALRALGSLLATLLGACVSPPELGPGGDPPPETESAAPDLGAAGDLGSIDQAAPGPDLAAADLRGASDLRARTDLRAQTDLRAPTDLRAVIDMRSVTDLRAQTDLRAATDLRPAADLAAPADLRATDPPPGAVPRPGMSISIQHLQAIVGGREFAGWDVYTELRTPGSGLPQTALGGCWLRRPDSTTGRSLMAGDLTIAGGPVGDLVITYNPTADLYEYELIGADLGDGALFAEGSALRLSASGGDDLRAVAVSGAPWRGVKLIDYKSPLTLTRLPSADLTLRWTAAPATGAQMEVSLQSPTQRIDCPVTDSGSYTVPRAIIDAVPPGPVYIVLSRFTTAQGGTTPDLGAIQLESRSSFQIVTQR